MKRKKIALFTAQPEAAHERRIIQGAADQCRRYGYHLLVFSPMTHLEFKRSDYVKAESNIYGLANFDDIDGLILDSVNLLPGTATDLLDELRERLRGYPDLPVVALEAALWDYPIIKNKNDEALRAMCRHAVNVHGKKKICILTGPQGIEVADERLAICLDELKALGITVADEHIVYGDFWYNSGDALARKIGEGSVSMPDAVLCTSSHMALGLIYRLKKYGIRVPEDIIVIGFDTTNEGKCDEVVLSAFDAADEESASDAVDYIRRKTEPGAEIIPYHKSVDKMFYAGMSCGCMPDYQSSLGTLRRAAYIVGHNSAADSDDREVDFGMLMESYCLEEFTAAGSVADCIRKIGSMVFLVHPLKDYCLCLKKDWAECEDNKQKGYPLEMDMALAVAANNDGTYSFNDKPFGFDSKEMLPLMNDEDCEPGIFYFSPIHFEGTSLGYTVLHRKLDGKVTVNLVYRSWLRFITNALEMIRVRSKLMSMSVMDPMTGLYNRRGLGIRLDELRSSADKDDKVFVAVIDMNGLKKINDIYGHAEGDAAIMILSRAVTESAGTGEICVRAGGDEFFIVGIGRYSEDDINKRREAFKKKIEDLSKPLGKPYDITASMGCCIEALSGELNMDNVFSRADNEMYKIKTVGI